MKLDLTKMFTLQKNSHLLLHCGDVPARLQVIGSCILYYNSPGREKRLLFEVDKSCDISVSFDTDIHIYTDKTVEVFCLQGEIVALENQDDSFVQPMPRDTMDPNMRAMWTRIQTERMMMDELRREMEYDRNQRNVERIDKQNSQSASQSAVEPIGEDQPAT